MTGAVPVEAAEEAVLGLCEIAADHADDAYGDPNPVSGELEDLLGLLRIWYAAASALLEDVED